MWTPPVIISAFVAAASLLFAVYSAAKNDTKQSATDFSALMAKLEYMQGDLKEIKADVSSVRKEVDAIKERLVVVEQSTKSAQHRIDEITNEKA